jgi:hypothetical protein
MKKKKPRVCEARPKGKKQHRILRVSSAAVVGVGSGRCGTRGGSGSGSGRFAGEVVAVVFVVVADPGHGNGSLVLFVAAFRREIEKVISVYEGFDAAAVG